MALAAIRLRGRFLPGWSGPPARLVEGVVGVALFTVLLQILGAFGILVPAVLIATSLIVGLGIYLGAWPWREPGASTEPLAPATPVIQTIVALAAAAFVATHWAT